MAEFDFLPLPVGNIIPSLEELFSSATAGAPGADATGLISQAGAGLDAGGYGGYGGGFQLPDFLQGSVAPTAPGPTAVEQLTPPSPSVGTVSNDPYGLGAMQDADRADARTVMRDAVAAGGGPSPQGLQVQSPPSTQTTAPPSKGLGDFMSSTLDYAKAHPEAALAMGMLGIGGLKQMHPLPGVNALKSQAEALNAAGQPLMAPLTKGAPLPAAMQSGIEQSASAQEAAIRSQFASMGLSGSTMEQQALNAVEQQKHQAYLTAAQGLYTQGLQTIGQATQADMAVTQAYAAQDQGLMTMLGRVAAAFAPVALKDQTKAQSATS